MEKINEERKMLNILLDKLNNMDLYSAGSSIKADSTAMFLLEIIEKYNPKKISPVVKKLFDMNQKYSYPECCEIIDGLIARCNDYILRIEGDASYIYKKYIEFIDLFNSYDIEYKIKKDISLEITQLDEMQRKISKNIEEITKKYEKISTRIDKINYDLIGTISLFVGAIFAVYGGFEIKKSVFEYIGTIQFEYLIISLLVIGFIELSIMSLLVYIVFRINNKDGREIWYIDGFYFCTMIICIIICLIIKQ